MEKLDSGAGRWFVSSVLLVSAPVLLVTIAILKFEIMIGLWLSILDVVLFLSVPYVMVPLLNKKDQKEDSELKGKYAYVSFLLNERRLIYILAIHIFYITISFVFPLISFVLIIPLPFIISFYRLIAKDRITFPTRG